MNKKVLLTFILSGTLGIANAQFYGYETPVQMPSMGVYGNSLQMMYIQGLRERAEYNNRLWDILKPIYDQACSLYNNNRYSDCDKLISDVFRNYTFYKGQEFLYARLLYLKGMSHVKLGSLDSGISLLVMAMEDGDNEASSELWGIFHSYYNTAVDCYKRADYSMCLYNINTALKTKFASGDAYILGGQASEALNAFNDAKQWYKLAKKHGSPIANEKLKALKVKQKESNK